MYILQGQYLVLRLIFPKFDIKWWGFYPEGNHLPNNVAVWTKILKMSTFHTSLILNVSEAVFQYPVATGKKKKKKSYPVCTTFQHLNISWFKAGNSLLFLSVVLFHFKGHSTVVRTYHLWFDKLNIRYIFSTVFSGEKVKLFYQTIKIKKIR